MPIELGTPLPQQTQPLPFKAWRPAGRVPARARMQFVERLAMLLETGMPLHAALTTLQQQTAQPRLAQAISEMADAVMNGRTFASAIASQGAMFPAAYVSLVAAAEGGGFLPEVLEQLVQMEERQEQLHNALVAAATYPAFLALLSVAVVTYVLIGVFPKFTEMFTSIKDQLPATTIMLMALSDVLRAHWPEITAALVGAGVLLVRWASSEGGRTLLDRAKLSLPFASALFMQIYLARIMRVMSTSLANRVSVLDTLDACRDAVPNREFRRFIGRIEEHVVQGRGFASAFEQEPAIPQMVRQMVATGEASGKLGLVMGRVADFYERELLQRITALSKLAEPAMLVIMGVVVGLIVTSLILPIFKLASAVH